MMNPINLCRLGINTLYFNYKIFGLRNLFKFWAIIGPRVKFGTLSRNSVTLHKPSFACFKIGVGSGSFHHGKYSASFIRIGLNSHIEIFGKFSMARGGVFNIGEGASAVFGDKFSANYGCIMSIAKSLICDTNVRIGWEVSIIDSDGHSIKAMDNQKMVNENRAIYLEENTWLAAKCTIMKGVHLAKNTIVPYGSIITKSNETECVVWGGSPNRILKQGVYRDYASES